MNMKENAIEWITGDGRMTVTLSQRKYIHKVEALCKKYPESCEICAVNEDGSIVAHLPLKALHLTIYEGRKDGFSHES